MRIIRLAILCLALCTPVAQGAPEAALTTQPATAGLFEHQPIGSHAARSRTTAGVAPDAGAFNYTRWALSLGLVLALIFIARYAGRCLMGMQHGASAGAISVLARHAVAPRQQLMLVQVGRRVVLVAGTSGQMNALAEITDADEIAEIMAQVNRRRVAAASSFRSLFQKASTAYGADSGAADAPEAEPVDELPAREPEPDPRLTRTRAELQGLLEKVRLISGAVKRN